MKNAYAMKLNAAKKQIDKERTRYIIQLEYDLMTVMLNRTFGFGKDRIAKACEALNALHEEYADAIISADGDYATDALKRAVDQIMMADR